MNWIPSALLFAQDDKKVNPGAGGGFEMFLPMIAIAVLFYFLLIRPQRREQQKRDQMLSTLKKNDRVVTIGGMLGTVANISADGQEVTLKVDDNTRIRMIRSSIQRILADESDGEKPTETRT